MTGETCETSEPLRRAVRREVFLDALRGAYRHEEDRAVFDRDDADPIGLSTYVREEGHLADKLGDRAGAIRAYRHYLALRSDPEPHLRADRDSVRSKLARLERNR